MKKFDLTSFVAVEAASFVARCIINKSFRVFNKFDLV